MQPQEGPRFSVKGEAKSCLSGAAASGDSLEFASLEVELVVKPQRIHPYPSMSSHFVANHGFPAFVDDGGFEVADLNQFVAAP